MKKNYLLALAALFALVSCEQQVDPGKPDDPTPQPTTNVKVTVNPHEVTLTAEEPAVRLAATLDPADATETVVWSSSDSLVATVTSRGYVEATGYGECFIYASVGDSKDSCHVYVKSYLESLVFNSAIVWDVDTTVAYDEKTGEYKVEHITASDGSEWNVYYAEALLFVFSDGLYINNSGQWDGTEQGAILEITAPMYYGTRYLNPDGGVQFSLGEWAVSADLEPQAHVSAPATLDEAEFINQMKLFLDEFNSGGTSYGQYLSAAGNAVSGPIVTVLEYNADYEGYVNSYIPDALIENALLSLGGASAVSKYMRELDYSTVTYKPFATDTVFGLNSGLKLAWDAETETASLLEEKVYFDPSITSNYGEIPADGAEAPALVPMHMPIISEDAELKANLERQLKEKNIKVIRMKR